MLKIKRIIARFFNHTIKLALFTVMYLLSCNSYAVEKELDKESTVFNQTFSWQAMAGLSVISSQIPLKGVDQKNVEDFLHLSILIDLYYKGFFIQSNHRRSIALTQGAELGYQLHVDDDWEIDILTKSYITGYLPDDLIERKDRPIPTLEGLSDRKIGDAIAIRYSHFDEDSIFSVDLADLTHFSEANGWLLDFYYNDLFIYKNWDIYVGGGLTYYSNQVTDYYYGVKPEEVTPARALYNPNASFKASFEIYAQYPISRKWSFNAGITQTYYSNVIKRSPLIDKQHLTQFMLGVIYVF